MTYTDGSRRRTTNLPRLCAGLLVASLFLGHEARADDPIANDTSVEVFYVLSLEDNDFILYIAEGRGFRLGWSRLVRLLDLLEGLGFPRDTRFISDVDSTEPQVVSSNYLEQPTIDLDTQVRLYKSLGSDFKPTGRYYLNFTGQDAFYASKYCAVGCRELLAAFGLSREDAQPMLESSLENPMLEIVNLNCLSGTPMVVCGDGAVEGAEACDEGESDTATCNYAGGLGVHACTASTCGDGYVNPASGEECDNGLENSDTAPDACRTDCTRAVPDEGDGCNADGDCPSGHACRATVCVQMPGVGEACNGEGECAPGLKCDNDLCCDQAAGQSCCHDHTHCGNGFACDTSSNVCYGTCTDGDSSLCAADDAVCVQNRCVARLDLGAPCFSDYECTSEFCVEGVCCDDACDGLCESCVSSGIAGAPPNGLCTPIPSPLDPASECSGSWGCSGQGSCNGRRAWRSPAPVLANPRGATEAPYVIHGRFGEVFAVWDQDGNVIGSWYVRGTGWSAPVALESKSARTNFRGGGYDVNNTLTISYATDGVPGLEIRRYNAVLQNWSAPQRLANGTSGEANLHMAPNGQMMLLYDTTDGCRYQLLNPHNTSSAPARCPLNSGFAASSLLTFNAEGHGATTWPQRNVGGKNDIWVARYSPRGGWTSGEMVDLATISSGRPAVAIDRAARVIVVWVDTNDDIWGRRYVPGRGWENRQRLRHNGDYPKFGVALSATPDGNATAAWHGWSSSNNPIDSQSYNRVWSHRFNGIAGTWTTARLMDSVANRNADFFDVTVGNDRVGNTLVLWSVDVNGGINQVRANRYPAGGGWQTRPTTLASSTDLGWAQIFVAPDGTATATWEDHDGSQWAPYAARFE